MPRAPHNRTLTLTDSQMADLRADLMTPADLQAGQSCTDRIVCADLLDVIDRIPDGMADLITIDPPYNLTKVYGGHRFARLSSADYEAYLRTWLPAVRRKLKADGSLYLCSDWRSSGAMAHALEEAGLTILNRITWGREKGRGAAANWKSGMEDIWFAVNDPTHYHFDLTAVMLKRRVRATYRQDGQPKDWQSTPDGNFRLTCPSNFWDDLTVPFWSMPENTDHPAQKPEKLYAKLILASCPPGGLVFDPFVGSGTSCVVAAKLGRHYCGIEQVEQYCLWALSRLRSARTDASIQGYADGVFRERNS